MAENGQEPNLIEKAEKSNNEDADDGDHDPQYEPIISLPEVEVPTLEEDETEMLNLRAKLYRYDSKESPPEWKERGTGTVKILHHKLNDTVRVVMRRDKTLKLCANHFILPSMELKPNASCERAWVYSVKADYADETVRSELLAIKFANVENALKWKEIFDEAKNIVSKNGTSTLDGTLEDEDTTISDDPPKLNDTFEDEKRSEVSSPKIEIITPEKTSNTEMAEKLSSLTIEETKEAESS